MKSNPNLKLLFVLFLMTFTFKANLFSQKDSLLRAISSYQDTSFQLIDKARGMLLKKFNEHDFKAALDLKNFLQKVENNEYISLYPIERWLLDYSLNDYEDVLKTVLVFDSAYYNSFHDRVRPSYDLLEKKLINYASEHQSTLMDAIDKSAQTNEEKEFLKLNLNYILFVSKEGSVDRDPLNNQASAFIEHFPESNYVPYSRKYIRYQFVPSDFGFGMNIGMAARLNSGNIRNTIDEGLLFDLGFVFSYKKWDYNLIMLVGPAQLKKDLSVKNKSWHKGSDATYLNLELSVAHDLLNSKRHRLSPSVGLALTDFSPSQDSIDQNSYYKNMSVDIGSIVWGLNYQFRYSVKNRGFQSNYGCINLRYALSYHITKESLYRGFVNYITLSWQFEMHGLKRKM